MILASSSLISGSCGLEQINRGIARYAIKCKFLHTGIYDMYIQLKQNFDIGSTCYGLSGCQKRAEIELWKGNKKIITLNIWQNLWLESEVVWIDSSNVGKLRFEIETEGDYMFYVNSSEGYMYIAVSALERLHALKFNHEN